MRETKPRTSFIGLILLASGWIFALAPQLDPTLLLSREDYFYGLLFVALMAWLFGVICGIVSWRFRSGKLVVALNGLSIAILNSIVFLALNQLTKE